MRDFASLRDSRLAGWIQAQGAFPSTMVDRIVPAATDADTTDAAAATGLWDAAPVSHEPFRQWVIEDHFADDARPAWNKVGAQFVTDVAPYEHMKLRLLNGAHSALAYLGYLAGHETISDTVADDVFRAYIVALWRDEIIPAVPPPRGVDLQGYAAELLARFANPAVRHRTWQIAMDGSQKLPQRLLSTIRERLSRGQPIGRLAIAVAAWIRYVGGVDEAGRPIDVRDPLAAQMLDALANAGPDPARRVAAILGLETVFGTGPAPLRPLRRGRHRRLCPAAGPARAPPSRKPEHQPRSYRRERWNKAGAGSAPTTWFRCMPSGRPGRAASSRPCITSPTAWCGALTRSSGGKRADRGRSVARPALERGREPAHP